MIPLQEIGALRHGAPKPPAERQLTGRAVLPGTEALRTVDLFDAMPVLNRREEIIGRDNAGFRYLSFARIVLDAGADGYAPVSARLAGDEEAVFYVNRGTARLRAGDAAYDLGAGDVLYAGLGAEIVAETEAVCDVSEFRAAGCSTRHPIRLVRHAEIEGTPLAAELGTKRPASRRTVYKLIDRNIEACRLLFGDTFMAQTGGVGSYPPHFHGPDGPFGLGEEAKEEIYHFRCASEIEGEPGYVLQNCGRPGEPVGAYVHVFDEQAVNVTPGFHDTIAPPTVRFMFTWCLASFTEGNRDWARLVTRPGYENEW